MGGQRLGPQKKMGHFAKTKTIALNKKVTPDWRDEGHPSRTRIMMNEAGTQAWEEGDAGAGVGLLKDASFEIVRKDWQAPDPFLVFQGPYGGPPANYWGGVFLHSNKY